MLCENSDRKEYVTLTNAVQIQGWKLNSARTGGDGIYCGRRRLHSTPFTNVLCSDPVQAETGYRSKFRIARHQTAFVLKCERRRKCIRIGNGILGLQVGALIMLSSVGTWI